MTGARGTEADGERLDRRIAWGVLLLFAGGAAVTWLAFARPPADVVATLPANERVALYQRERATFEELCVRPARPDEPACASRAKLLAELPECDAACQRTAAIFLPRPTR